MALWKSSRWQRLCIQLTREERKTSAKANSYLWWEKKTNWFFFPQPSPRYFWKKEKQPNYISDFSIHMEIFVSKNNIALLLDSFKNYYLIILRYITKLQLKTHKTPPTRQGLDEFLLQCATCPAAKFLLTTSLLEKCVHLSFQNISSCKIVKEGQYSEHPDELKMQKKGRRSVRKGAGYHVWQEKSYINTA